jgi:hypothetical protein
MVKLKGQRSSHLGWFRLKCPWYWVNSSLLIAVSRGVIIDATSLMCSTYRSAARGVGWSGRVMSSLKQYYWRLDKSCWWGIMVNDDQDGFIEWDWILRVGPLSKRTKSFCGEISVFYDLNQTIFTDSDANNVLPNNIPISHSFTELWALFVWRRSGLLDTSAV